ncbi:hypothetical protein FIBSPDRAFT_979297 [Athelia psychrophila]|uniref:Uncharacterized protein n=1 Tax=Athelia psychrophila TaxID=1759441 RepID=A0A166DQT1_9AGAM|nr:hypothetical protein FIBSPDRAFT_979297 [Fibularhizoctonia sp. CBS 109695]
MQHPRRPAPLPCVLCAHGGMAARWWETVEIVLNVLEEPRAEEKPAAHRREHAVSLWARVLGVGDWMCPIDGFQRFYTGYRDKFLRWAKDISRCPGGKLHIMLSSRRERDIEDNLVDINGLERVNFAGGSANPDIVKFVGKKLVELIIWKKLDPEI